MLNIDDIKLSYSGHHIDLLLVHVNFARHEGKCVNASVALWERKCKAVYRMPKL